MRDTLAARQVHSRGSVESLLTSFFGYVAYCQWQLGGLQVPAHPSIATVPFHTRRLAFRAFSGSS